MNINEEIQTCIDRITSKLHLLDLDRLKRIEDEIDLIITKVCGYLGLIKCLS